MVSLDGGINSFPQGHYSFDLKVHGETNNFM